MNYFAVPAKTVNGSVKCAIQVVDENEKVLKSFYYTCGNHDEKIAAYLKAMDYMDTLK
jgi:hypothetical protein